MPEEVTRIGYENDFPLIVKGKTGKDVQTSGNSSESNTKPIE